MEIRRERTFLNVEWWNSIPQELKKEANAYSNNESIRDIVNNV